MEMWTSLLIVLAVFALGDVISILTKARISSLFVIMMTFLILFLTHTIPPDIVKRAGLGTLGPIAIGMLLVNMGSSVDVRMLKREWRSVAGSIISMIIAVVSCLAMIPPYWSGKCPCLGARHQWRRDCDQYDGSGRP